MGNRPREDLPGISTDRLPPAPDGWDLETLRRGLEDATGVGQALLRPANTDEADLYTSDNGLGNYEDDFYTSGGGLGSNKDCSSETDNNRESDGGVLGLPTDGDLEPVTIERPLPMSRAGTRSQSRTIRSQSLARHSAALPYPLLSTTHKPRSPSRAVHHRDCWLRKHLARSLSAHSVRSRKTGSKANRSL